MATAGMRAGRRLGAAGFVLFLALVPLLAGPAAVVDEILGLPLQLDRQLLSIFIFALWALALHLQVGTAGIMQLGSAAFFAVGAYTAGILTVQKFPFQYGFAAGLLASTAVAGCLGAALGGLCARVRGDQLAMVTLGFGEVVRVVLLNVESMTDGSRGLNPLPAPTLPWGLARALHPWLGDGASETAAFLPVYWTALAALCLFYLALERLERAPLGQAMVALREDSLAAASVGHAPLMLKVAAMGLGGAGVGFAGALYATYLTTTAEPNTYDANLSFMVLCSVILGGLSSRLGVLLGAALLLGFDNLLTPLCGRVFTLVAGEDVLAGTWGNFANWRWLIFGGALVLTMRLRPTGLLTRPRPAAAPQNAAHAMVAT